MKFFVDTLGYYKFLRLNQGYSVVLRIIHFLDHTVKICYFYDLVQNCDEFGTISCDKCQLADRFVVHHADCLQGINFVPVSVVLEKWISSRAAIKSLPASSKHSFSEQFNVILIRAYKLEVEWDERGWIHQKT